MSAEVAAVCRAAGQFLDADDQDLEAWLIGVGTGLLDDDQPAPTNLPNDAIRTAALSTYTDGLTDGRNTAFSLSLIAAAARGPAEQFYFERQLLDSLRTPWEPSLTELLLAPHRKVERAFNQPARREQRPGPNEPCPCGSGRKYKKCCGAPRAGA